MYDATQLKISKWPFFLGDAFMLGLAFFIVWQAELPLTQWEVVACAVCVLLGALLGIIPFFLQHRIMLKTIEASAVVSTANRIKNLEKIAAQIGTVGTLWENAHLSAEKINGASKEIADAMQSELKDFQEFLKKANDGERATLRLEVEKLHRAEGDWVQVVVRILDHVFALYAAAEKSGQQSLINQIGQFQNACRDSARRIGISQLVAARAETFDATRHKWADGDKPEAGALVSETLASGYSYQGKLIRPALVRVKQDAAARPKTTPDEPADREQNQLPLEAANPSST
jgi:molecular chaperone GrpE (heat shock protein)